MTVIGVLATHAQISATLTGEIEVAAFPPSVLSGAFVNTNRIRLLHEGPALISPGLPAFTYDAAYHDPALPIVPGDATFGNAITSPYDGPGLPAAGMEVHSVLLHFDPDLSGKPFSLTLGIARTASITFNRRIIGVYLTSAALNATDAVFGPAGVTYPTESGRDMEFNYDGDEYFISPDRYTLSLKMFTHNGGRLDQMRILLDPTPRPVTLKLEEGPPATLRFSSLPGDRFDIHRTADLAAGFGTPVATNISAAGGATVVTGTIEVLSGGITLVDNDTDFNTALTNGAAYMFVPGAGTIAGIASEVISWSGSSITLADNFGDALSWTGTYTIETPAKETIWVDPAPAPEQRAFYQVRRR